MSATCSKHIIAHVANFIMWYVQNTILNRLSLSHKKIRCCHAQMQGTFEFWLGNKSIWDGAACLLFIGIGKGSKDLD